MLSLEGHHFLYMCLQHWLWTNSESGFSSAALNAAVMVNLQWCSCSVFTPVTISGSTGNCCFEQDKWATEWIFRKCKIDIWFKRTFTYNQEFAALGFTSLKVPGVFQIIHIIPKGMQTIEDMAMNQPIP